MPMTMGDHVAMTLDCCTVRSGLKSIVAHVAPMSHVLAENVQVIDLELHITILQMILHANSKLWKSNKQLCPQKQQRRGK